MSNLTVDIDYGYGVTEYKKNYCWRWYRKWDECKCLEKLEERMKRERKRAMTAVEGRAEKKRKRR